MCVQTHRDTTHMYTNTAHSNTNIHLHAHMNACTATKQCVYTHFLHILTHSSASLTLGLCSHLQIKILGELCCGEQDFVC